MFACGTIEDPEIKGKLDKINKIPSLLETRCLPNIHRKNGLESPPQFVAATNATIVPELSAPSLNCGMSIFKTNLKKEDFSENFLNEFAKNLRGGVAARLSFLKNILLRLGLTKRERMPYDISREELENFFLDGAAAALKKYKLPAYERYNIERGGCALDDSEKKGVDFKDLVPNSSYKNALHELGYNFGGNHFLEFHFVEKIIDEAAAKQFGIGENQIVIFYHGGGGHATYHLGRYFGRRKKNSLPAKIALFFLKLRFHFGSKEGRNNFRARWNAYFSAKQYHEIPLGSAEGKRLMMSIKISLNYGYAFRAALLRRIKDALPKGDVSFIWDAAHNSITEENIGGRRLVVHRQDAARAIEGKPVMISGANNTLSYIGAGSSNLEKTLNSVTPSAGKTIENTGGKPEPQYETLISKRKNPDLARKTHISSDGLFAVAEPFEKAGIIKPVAYIRPLASVKGH